VNWKKIELTFPEATTGEASSKTPNDEKAAGLVSEKSRGDKTAIELFVTGIRGWEAELRRRLEDGKPSSQ
jgi:hypothetical protein